MRKKLIFAAAAVSAMLLALASCSKEVPVEAIEQESREMAPGEAPVFTATIASNAAAGEAAIDASAATKTTVDVTDGKVAWEAADEITVRDASGATAVYAIQSIDAATGKATFAIKDGEVVPGEGPYTATYGTEPAKQQTYSATAGKLYMTAPETEDNSFTFTVRCGLMKLSLTRAGESIRTIAVTGTPAGGSEATYTLTCDSAVSIADAKDFFVALPAGSYTGIAVTNAANAVCTLNAASGVAIAANHIKPVTFGADKLRFFHEIVVPDLVDLGLSVKWASFNLGASNPEEYGAYYQWAGTKDMSDTSNWLDFGNCPYHTDDVWSTGWTKYIPSDFGVLWSGTGDSDNKAALDSEDDAARVALGGNWRMPTAAEWAELMNGDNCTWEWDPERNGYKVTSRKTGYAGNSIFLPAGGSRIRDELNEPGVSGNYWSSMLKPCSRDGVDDPIYARSLAMRQDGRFLSDNIRCGAISVRPVCPDGGALPGEFTVNDEGKKVRFSCGNLWADASDMDDIKLHFEAAQEDFCYPYAAAHVSYFSWGGSVSDAVGIGDCGAYLFCDEDHKVSVDGSESVYYALSLDEWLYMFHHHDYKWAKVNGAEGYVIAPDNFGGVIKDSYADEAELAGGNLIFLPAAGCKSEASVIDVGIRGYYFTSTPDAVEEAYAHGVHFGENGLNEEITSMHRFTSHSLRLVRDVK